MNIAMNRIMKEFKEVVANEGVSEFCLDEIDIFRFRFRMELSYKCPKEK